MFTALLVSGPIVDHTPLEDDRACGSRVELIKSSRDITGIKILRGPDKDVYIEGESFDSTGMVVEVIYNDTYTAIVEDYNIIVNNPLTTDDTYVTVSYGVKSATVPITVNPVAQKELTSIKITKAPDKTLYYEGEKLDLTGMEVKAYYDNDETNGEIITGYTVNPIANTEVTQVYPKDGEIKVTYNGFEDSCNITVKPIKDIPEKDIQGIEIVEKPKTIYNEGEGLTTQGLKVKVVYLDSKGTQQETIIENGAEGLATNPTSGTKLTQTNKIVQVTYKGKEASYSITVNPVSQREFTGIEITKAPNKTLYYEGEKLDLTGMEVKACYSNGDKEIVTNYTTEPITGTKVTKTNPASGKITVKYNGKQDSFNITVKPVSQIPEEDIKEIKIETQPSKTEFYVEEKFTAEGLKIKVIFTDSVGKESSVIIENGFETEPSSEKGNEYVFKKQDIGAKTVKVIYRGKFEDSYNIMVNPVAERELTKIEITKSPDKTVYYEGEKFETKGMKVIAIYNNGETKEITGYKANPNRSLTIEDTIIKVSYTEGGITKTAEQRIKVMEREIKIPYTGTKPLVITVAGLMLISIMSFIQYKRIKL